MTFQKLSIYLQIALTDAYILFSKAFNFVDIKSLLVVALILRRVLCRPCLFYLVLSILSSLPYCALNFCGVGASLFVQSYCLSLVVPHGANGLVCNPSIS